MAKIRAYAAIYGDVLSEHRMCLCGMLAAGYDTLSEPMQEAVIDFFDANEAWLTGVLEQGQESGRITLNGPAREAAQVIVSGLEGAMLIARPYNDVERFNAAATRLLTGLVSSLALLPRTLGVDDRPGQHGGQQVGDAQADHHIDHRRTDLALPAPLQGERQHHGRNGEESDDPPKNTPGRGVTTDSRWASPVAAKASTNAVRA